MADTPPIDPSLSKLLAGSIGAFISLRFVSGSAIERWTMAIGGAALSYLAATPVAQWLGMSNAEGLVGFLIGLFGMSVAAKVYEGIQGMPAAQMAQDAWAAVKRRMGG